MTDTGGAPAGEETQKSGGSPPAFQWKVPDNWGNKAREAVVAAHEGEIHNDYLPPTDEEVTIVQNLIAGVSDMEQKYLGQLDDVTLIRFVRGFTLNQWAKLPLEEATKKNS
jgi:hypothetical protein